MIPDIPSPRPPPYALGFSRKDGQVRCAEIQVTPDSDSGYETLLRKFPRRMVTISMEEYAAIRSRVETAKAEAK